MTDRGTRVRWTTAALVAPAAAALFTGTTVWATSHQPGAPATSAAPASVPEQAADPLVASLSAAVDANSAQVASLRDTLGTLQRQIAAIAKGARIPLARPAARRATNAAASSATRRSTSTARTSTSTRTSAPATHTTTSASGAK